MTKTFTEIEKAFNAVGINQINIEKFSRIINREYNTNIANVIISEAKKMQWNAIYQFPEIIDLFHSLDFEIDIRTKLLSAVTSEIDNLVGKDIEQIYIADAGCGVGIESCALGWMYEDSVNIHGYDPKPERTIMAARRARKTNLNNITFHISDHEKAAEFIQPQDIVFAGNSIYYNTKDQFKQTYLSLKNIIKPQGRLIVQSYVRNGNGLNKPFHLEIYSQIGLTLESHSECADNIFNATLRVK
jgi:2-polyprenyl-3-methyl-5-hydroxy-6-metoxy-1,4-benzoquinol methylase